ncbi:hypothetical protein TWF481_000291 [Arthrobotrys musiformis]|uniref:G domain-containing protein n=1 Tax=Arthrobotrys musiformis TaxID=47236 RepID=A0AAV9WNA8_9PEZI
MGEPIPELPLKYKNVMVLGLTQNGKSSFVGSILKYDPANLEDSATPVVGNGSTSQTKDIKNYRATINIRQYNARKKGRRMDITHTSEGSRVVITYNDEGEELSREYEPLEFKETVDPETKKTIFITQEFKQSIRRLQGGLKPDAPEPSGCSVHLNIYDPPGLSDSDGIKDLEKDFMKQGYTKAEAEEAATKCTRNLVDEKHKLAILKKAIEIGVLHGVCIVIRDGKSFGQELKELQSLVGVFRSISRDLKFYIIHTMVTSVTMFQAKTLNRIRMSEEFFKLRATHFFINNQPDTGDEADPLSQYFASRVLSDFLLELTEAPGIKVTNLTYQKSDNSLGETVASSLRIYSSHLESNNRLLQQKVRELDIANRPNVRKAELYDDELKELRLERERASVRQRLATGGYASVLVSIASRDHHAILARIGSKESDLLHRKSQQERVLSSYRKEKSQYESKVEENSHSLKYLGDLIQKIRSRHLSEKEISDTTSRQMQLRHANSLYCVAMSYSCTVTIPKELIPQIVAISQTGSRRRLYEHAEFHYEMRKTVLGVLNPMRKRFLFHQRLQGELDTTYRFVREWLGSDGLVEDLEGSLKQIIKDTMPSGNLDQEISREGKTLSIYESQVHERLRGLKLKLQLWIDNTQTGLEEIFEEIHSIKGHVDDTVGRLQRLLEEWNTKLRYHEESFDAAHKAMEILDMNRQQYTLEEFIVLRLAAEEFERKPSSEYPFVKLAQSIAYANQILTSDG